MKLLFVLCSMLTIGAGVMVAVELYNAYVMEMEV